MAMQLWVLKCEGCLKAYMHIQCTNKLWYAINDETICGGSQEESVANVYGF